MKSIVTALLTLLPFAVGAMPCAPFNEASNGLAAGYGETRQSFMLDGAGRMVSIFANTETGSWTLTITTPDMITCGISAGNNYQATPTAPDVGEDS